MLAFTEWNPTTGRDIRMLPSEGDRTPLSFLAGSFNEDSPAFSPDGGWLAYVSDESGREEVYLMSYPGPGRKVVVSTDGGREPVWSADGRELFYREGDTMMVVAVKTGPRLSPGKPRPLFEGRYSAAYDVSRDGQRFVIVQLAERAAPTQLNVVLNWFEELKRRVPTDK